MDGTCGNASPSRSDSSKFEPTDRGAPIVNEAEVLSILTGEPTPGICTGCRFNPLTGNQKKWCSKCYAILRGEREQRNLRRLRAEVLKVLGSRCRCCGYPYLAVMEIDHVKGKDKPGKKEANNCAAYSRMLRRLKKDPFYLQLLCPTCHEAKTKGVL